MRRTRTIAIILALLACLVALPAQAAEKPSPEAALTLLREGNLRFAAGETLHPNTGAERLAQAGREDQGDHAYATVLACSDSRVPVERLFDAGVMDLFVVRVAGNVVRTDEAGSIEYGLAHVHTPVLVVLGHTQCGAVTAVTREAQGHGHELERNIPPLIAPIRPAVERAMAEHPGADEDALVAAAVEQNIWQAVADLFAVSPAVRGLVQSGRAKVVGAVYDVSTGLVRWLPEGPVADILRGAEARPEPQRRSVAD